MWYPGLSRGDNGFYLGNFSASRIGLNPSITIKNYSETISGMENKFLLKVSGGGADSNWQTLAWWRANTFNLPTIAWCASPAWNTCGTMGVSTTLKMDSSADDTFKDGSLSFDLLVDAQQAP